MVYDFHFHFCTRNLFAINLYNEQKISKSDFGGIGTFLHARSHLLLKLAVKINLCYEYDRHSNMLQQETYVTHTN